MPSLAASIPYPWPHDGCLDPGRLALVVAGAQTAWMEASCDPASVGARIACVVRAMRDAGGIVVVLHHSGPVKNRPTPFPPEARSTGAAPWLVPGGGDVVVRSGGIDGFHGGPLDDELRRRGIDHLVLGGFGLEACVDSTLRSANDRGYECLTLTDAVAPFSPELGRHVLSTISMSGGIFGAIGSSADLLDALSLVRPTVPLEAP